MKDLIELNALAVEFRDMLSINPYSPIDLFNIIPSKFPDYSIVFYPMSYYTSGMCIKNDKNSIIAINSNLSLGRQRFTLAHELYHLLYDENYNKDVIVCNFNDSSDSEQEAEKFGSFLLMPYEGLKKYMKVNDIKKWDLDSVIFLQQYFQISHKAVIVRLKQDGFISENEYEDLKKVTITREATQRGFGKSLYITPNPDHRRRLIGNYVRLVENASSKHLISEGKRRSLLLDGFQDDLIFDFKGE